MVQYRMHIKWIRTGLVLMLVAVSGATAFMLVDSVVAQAQAGQSPGNPLNYTLVQDRFEFSDSPYILTLQFRGTPITTNAVEWHVGSLPIGVHLAEIKRRNGQNEFAFQGVAPASEYTFNIYATVMQANKQLAFVQLTVAIYVA